MTPTDLRRAAADLIEREGWWPSEYGGRSMFEAVFEVAEDHDQYLGTLMELSNDARPNCSLRAWEQAPSRTKAEVLALLLGEGNDA